MPEKKETTDFSIMRFFMKDLSSLNLTKDICGNCNFIYPCTSSTGSLSECVCPNCNQVKPGLWPNKNFLLLLDRLYYLKKIKKAKELSVIVVCSIFEGMIDNFLRQYLSKIEKIPTKYIELLWKRYSSVDQRVDQLFGYIIGTPFKDEIKNFMYPSFYDDWKELKDARNDFIHLKNTFTKNKAINKAFDILPELLRVFIELNNKYLVKKVCKSTAPKSCDNKNDNTVNIYSTPTT